VARFDAIAAVTGALSGLLDAAATADGEQIAVSPMTAAGLAANLQPGTRTLGLWLHAVTPNAQRRSVRPPVVPGRPRRLPGTAVDLHYLLVARASDALAQQRLLGWGIRVLEDHPSLPAAVLDNGAFDGCFADDESLELTLETLTGAEENDIWQVAQTARVPAAPYVARMVVLDSRRLLADAPAVQERDLVVSS
jgi:hypothetical protein